MPRPRAIYTPLSRTSVPTTSALAISPFFSMGATTHHNITCLMLIPFSFSQEVYRSGLVADKRKGNFLPCSRYALSCSCSKAAQTEFICRYATTGREFTVDHSLNVGLNSKAWHSQSTSYPQDVYRTSFRVCGWEESTKFIPAFYSAGVNISRAQGFVVE